MPELPEVETIVRGLNRRVSGEAIESVWIGSKRQPLKSSAKKIVSTLEGKRVERVHRAGKHIVFDLVGGGVDAVSSRKTNAGQVNPGAAQWIVHLGMTGRVVVTEPDEAIPKHTHLIARLASGRELRFVDPRMFGKLSVHNGGFDPGGLEPLEATEEQFIGLFRTRKTPIKSALLNQKLLRGVGNIYADESLYRAGIRPRRRAASLTREELRKLHHGVQDVLVEAIASGGSSISDYVNDNGDEGFFQFEHRVYGREGEACYRCKAPIRRVVLSGRSSHYCAKCQK